MTPSCLTINDYANGSPELADLAPIVASARVSTVAQPMGIQPAHYLSLTGQSRVPTELGEQTELGKQTELVDRNIITDPLEVVSYVSGNEPYDYFAQ